MTSGKFEDLTGRKFGRLIVIKRVENSIRSDGGIQPQWLCRCEKDGNEIITLGERLRNGQVTSCGCYHRERVIESNVIDLVGKTFGRLVVIKYSGNSKWLCLCENEGNEIIVSTANLTSGTTKSCGCFRKEELSKRTIDLSGQRFGKLLITKFHGRISKKTYWECLCDCGNTHIVAAGALQQGVTNSCGCLKESLIANQLKKYCLDNYNAITEYNKVKNPKTNSFLFYDIYIPNSIFIEIHGNQHYNYDPYFHKSRKDFEDSKKRDRIKKSYAKKNGTYIEIDLRKIKTIEEAIKFMEEHMNGDN